MSAAPPRIGSGLDVHAFATDDRPLRLGGVTFPGHRGLQGHSDGDAVMHATADAVLGAAALGDLGTRFGSAEPERAAADSATFVTEALAAASASGFVVGNVDVTIAAKGPKLGSRRDDMRAALATSLDVSTDRVSVKATTTDGLGPLGSGEGIAVFATALLAESHLR